MCEVRTAKSCARTACRREIKRCVRIWNDPTSPGGYRDYCLKCGLKIIQVNNPDQYQLRYEVLMPFSAVDLGARFQYPGSTSVWIKIDGAGCGKIVEYDPRHIRFGNWVGQMVCSAKEEESDECLVWVVG